MQWRTKNELMNRAHMDGGSWGAQDQVARAAALLLLFVRQSGPCLPCEDDPRNLGSATTLYLDHTYSQM
jgi:hypothetical protein